MLNPGILSNKLKKDLVTRCIRFFPVKEEIYSWCNLARSIDSILRCNFRNHVLNTLWKLIFLYIIVMYISWKVYSKKYEISQINIYITDKDLLFSMKTNLLYFFLRIRFMLRFGYDMPNFWCLCNTYIQWWNFFHFKQKEYFNSSKRIKAQYIR